MSMSDRWADEESAGAIVVSQCSLCAHRGTLGDGGYCAAFPGGIPEDLLLNRADHRKPFEGDEGMGVPGTHVLFEPRADVPAPALAALRRTLDALG